MVWRKVTNSSAIREMIDIPTVVRDGDAAAVHGKGGGGLCSTSLSEGSDKGSDEDKGSVTGSNDPNNRSAVPPKISVHSASLRRC